MTRTYEPLKMPQPSYEPMNTYEPMNAYGLKTCEPSKGSPA